jgi:hypothetical protein
VSFRVGCILALILRRQLFLRNGCVISGIVVLEGLPPSHGVVRNDLERTVLLHVARCRAELRTTIVHRRLSTRETSAERCMNVFLGCGVADAILRETTMSLG